MNTLENDDIKFWIEDGILYSEFKNPVIVTLEKIKEFIALRHEISNGKKQYWCYSITNIKEIPKPARDYAEKNGQDFLHACAVIINSHLTAFLFNSFQKLKKPTIPFRMFTNKEDAITWLKEMKQQNEK